jgi:glycosyltransferase involved in cell wall biosynthesis
MVVEAGLAPGERVRSLPVLPPWRLDPAAEQGTRDPARRVALRRELGVRPGVRLVVGVTEHSCAEDVECWPAAVRRLERTDVQVLCPPRDRTAVPLPVLLAAADLVVAAGGELTATSAAVPALAAGVPVVAVTTDPAAELVEAGRTGLVVSPRLDAVVDAIVACLDRRPTSWRCGREQVPRPVHELARCLLPAYGEALTWSLRRGRGR